MRIALHRVESDCLKTIYDKVIPKEETLELVVPDVSADIGRILDVRGQFLLSSQRARENEVHISASVEMTVIYASEDGGKIQFVSTAVPFDHTAAVEGADENSETVVRCELCYLDARTLNPRKLLLRAGVNMHLRCFAPDKCVFWDNVAEETQMPVHILRKEIVHCPVVGVRDKSFIISDEYRLSPGREESVKMLSAATETCVQDAKSVGNKLIVKAEAVTNAVFLNESDGSLFSEMFSTPFSQIIEVDTYGDSIDSTVSVLLKDSEFTVIPDRENGCRISAQLNMTAQALSMERKAAVYLADAYSNEFALSAENTLTKISECMPPKMLRLSPEGRLQQKETLSEIMYVAVSALCTLTDGGSIGCEVSVSGVGKTESGEIEPIELKLRAEEAIPLAKNQMLTVCAVCCGPLTVNGMPESAEIKADVDIEYRISENVEFGAVSGMELDESSPLRCDNCPSLVVLCSEKEADLWNLAKKYGSTMEIIENANSMNGDFSVSRRPLLIPRAN